MKSKQKKAIAQAMRDAAEVLSNTPTIAKASYVDPRVVDRYRAGETVDPERPKSREQEVLKMLFEPPTEPLARKPTSPDRPAPIPAPQAPIPGASGRMYWFTTVQASGTGTALCRLLPQEPGTR